MNTAVRHERIDSRRFLFDGVVVDAAAARLFVDGRERICSQRALRLIVIMCESPAQVLTKQAVIERLWPGGQIVSDEALTQAVFRARACLDRYADRLVTVRGVGLRLDAEVRCDDGFAPIEPAPIAKDVAAEIVSARPATSDISAPLAAMVSSPVPPPPPPAAIEAPRASVPLSVALASTSAATPRRITPLLGGVLLLAVLAVALGLGWILRAATDAVPDARLDVGYGIAPDDAFVSQADSLALLREAFEHEGRGDRARARALLETVHSSDPTTPLPAMFLALWAAGGGDAPTSQRWLAQAQARLEPLRSPLLTAFDRYIDAERRGAPQDVLRYAGAVLDLRPQAWQMRLARAHLLLADGLRDAARQELGAIEFGQLGHRKLAMALADRASLGDVDAAEATLARIERDAAPDAMLIYTRARIAWSRGDTAAAAAAFEATAEQARREARFDLYNRSLANLGVIAMLRGEREAAIRLLERARLGMVESNWTNDEADLSLMLAQLRALEGDAATSALELARAAQVAARSNAEAYRVLWRVFAQRLQPQATSDAALQAGLDSEPELAPLLQAHAAHARGDLAAAREALATARLRILPTSPLHDELRLMQQRAGLAPDEATTVDPPYPPLARFASRIAMQAESDAAGADAP